MSPWFLFRDLLPSALAHTRQSPLSLALAYVNAATSLTLHLLSRFATCSACLLIILNLRSLPFGWHIQLFWPIAKKGCLMLWECARTFSFSSATRKAAACKYLDNLSPVGQNPLDKIMITTAWAGPDVCDYNWHLSNSSYSKILDSARMGCAVDVLPYFGRAGGWIALGGTQFHFLREIPMFSWYEIRTQIVAWDHKWIYLTHRFVTHHKRGSGPKKLNPLWTPLIGLTPSSSKASLKATVPLSPITTAKAAAVAAAATAAPEWDGGTVHCIAVSIMVFKYGRITVPNTLVLAGEGLGATPGQGIAARSRALALGLDGMAELYRGGWRTVPEGRERWWDEAMKGLEERVEKQLGKITGFKRDWRVE